VDAIGFHPGRHTEPAKGRKASSRNLRFLVSVAVAMLRDDEYQPSQRERQQVLDDAVGRAWQRMRGVFNASEFRDDKSVWDEIRTELEPAPPTADSDDIRRALDGFITAEREAWQKGLWTALVSWRVGFAAGIFGTALLLYLVADYLTGPGEVDSDVDYGGVGGAVLNVAFVGFFLSIALAAWAGISRLAGGEPVENVLPRLQKERDLFVQDLDQLLDREWAGPVTSRVYRAHQNPNFRSPLRLTDATELSGATSDPVRTPEFRRLDELLGGRGGVSIGVCGPRGVGKSTLLAATCRSSFDQTPRTIGFVKPVPVAYDHVEFLRSLLATLIKEVERCFGIDEVEAGHRGWRATAFAAATVIIATSLVIDLTAGSREGGLVPAPSTVEGLGFRISVVTLGLGTLLVALAVGWLWRRAKRRPSERAERELRGACQRARLALAENVTMTTSTVASIGSAGATLGRTGGRQVARGAVSHPDLADAFREFVAFVHEHKKALFLIGIDELDKLTSDEARTFLNGAKAIFGSPGASFVVSVSEDAMSDFERRGLPIRDAFDSSLDEVLGLKEMNINDSTEVLSKRSNYAFPKAFGALCHSLSGGLPRDLLRVARKLTRENAKVKADPDKYGKMRYLCGRLVADDLDAKSNAVWVAARQITVEPYGLRFRSWLSTVERKRGSATDLLKVCRRYLEFPVLAPDEAVPGADLTVLIERLDRLTLEFVGYRYFAVTLLQFYANTADSELDEALRPGPGGLQSLSFARTRFADDPRLAWRIITDFRKAREMASPLPVPTEGLRLPPAQDQAAPEVELEETETRGGSWVSELSESG
jgi:hypothetical protein